jgi:capsid assembly protease
MLLPHVASRLFNCPLAIHRDKASMILAAIADRFDVPGGVHLEGQVLVPMAFAYDDDDDQLRDARDPGYDRAGPVAVIPVVGTLVQKLGSLRPYSGMTGYNSIRQAFTTALTDDTVEAIVLDVDSPGGEVAGVFDLVDAIYEARGTKPIHAILSETAYSAAYAIASAADVITVPRTGGTGSIGVICMHVDYSKALTDAGLKVTLITYGERKSDGHSEIPLSDAALERFQADVNNLGELFVETVARNRGIAASAVRDMQATTYLGGAGVTQRLADAVAAPDEAFRALVNDLAPSRWSETA